VIAADRMTCDEFKQMAPAYALIALDEEERSACADHLATGCHRGCREAVASAEMLAAQLGAALIPERPSPHVWRAIAARLPQDRGAATLPDEAARRRGLYHLCGWLVAAALVGVYLYNAPIDLRALQAVMGLGGQLASSGH
jgi:anti-sigma-K factor RskA